MTSIINNNNNINIIILKLSLFALPINFFLYQDVNNIIITNYNRKKKLLKISHIKKALNEILKSF